MRAIWMPDAKVDGRKVHTLLLSPAAPSRRRSAPLSRYDRLAPPVPDLDALLCQ